MYKDRYKKGSYGGKAVVVHRQSRVLAEQQANRYAKAIAGRDGGAPLANRGFGNMAYRMNREKKFFDIAVTEYSVNTTGTFTLLFVPTLGSDYNNRIGRKTVSKSIYIRGWLFIRAAVNLANTPVPAQMCRFIIFIDSQPNGQTPAVTDLLLSAGVASQLNPNNRDRFRIIKDKQFVMDPYFANDQSQIWNRTVHAIKCYKKINLETIFGQTTAGSIGDINTGALYMFWLGSTAAGDTQSTATVSTRVRFDDS